MKKLDLRKELKCLYSPSHREVTLVRVPKFNFAMIDGQGDPNVSRDFQEAIQALYSVSYTLKFMFKLERKIDYPVMALEGLWWTEGTKTFDVTRRDSWKWNLMILQPKIVKREVFKEAVKRAREKKDQSALDKVRFESFQEGMCVQIMHVGPYAEEGPTIEKLQVYAREHGYEIHGKHHEIYLSDPRRSKPEKMKTVLRQAVVRQ